MPDIAGQVVILTVSDVERSTDWFCRLLGMEEASRYVQPDGHVALAHLAEQRSGVELCLVAYCPSGGGFDEFRIGLDHLEFF
jgi:catechol 2,3-dioxygenase-like lactoylglutathione lyase family enzyme